VQFVGSSDVLTNTVDANTNVAFMVNGASVFGGTSSQVQGTADLTPDLTANTRISDLRGATGQGVQLGSIQIGNGTTTAVVDLSQASSVSDVVNAINAAGVGGITASITGQGITLTGSPADNIAVTDLGGGSTAAELGIASGGAGVGNPLVGSNTQPNVTVFTPISALRNGLGIDPAGITIKNGLQSANVSFAGLTTVGDLLNAINGSKTSVKATIDPSGTGIDIVNPVQGSQMTISENGGTSAADLGVQSFTPQTLLSDLNGGNGVGLAASGNDFTVTAKDGTSFGVSLAGATTVQDVINKINAASGGTVVASFSATTNGISLNDTTGGGGPFTVAAANASTAATDLGLTQNAAVGTTITGTDVNPIAAGGLFADLSKLRNALRNGDQQGITEASQGLQNDYNQAVQARGVAGAQVQEMQSRQDQITTENTATQSLMSQLSDTDFTAAITKFQTLQTSLQATLQTAAKTLNLSLLNFLG
jgi:flagellin-like hook-associated protein FlgL